MRELVIVGAGGLGRVLKQYVDDVNRVSAQWHFLGFVDDAAEDVSLHQPGIPVLGSTEWLASHLGIEVLIGVGQPTVRRDIMKRLLAAGSSNFAKLVHPKSYIPSSVRIGSGTIVYPGVCIDPYAGIGEFVILGRNANIGHDTVLEDFVTVSPGCSIGGEVILETGAFIGIGACTIQQVRVGKWSVVGAGSAVIGDVADGATVVGVPARPIGKKNTPT